MARWLSGKEIVDRYSVGEGRLKRYSMRGDLPSMVDNGGVQRFDVEAVASLFLERGVQAQGMILGGNASLGTLGTTRLGVDPSLTARKPARRRARVRRNMVYGDVAAAHDAQGSHTAASDLLSKVG